MPSLWSACHGQLAAHCGVETRRPSSTIASLVSVSVVFVCWPARRDTCHPVARLAASTNRVSRASSLSTSMQCRFHVLVKSSFDRVLSGRAVIRNPAQSAAYCWLFGITNRLCDFTNSKRGHAAPVQSLCRSPEVRCQADRTGDTSVHGVTYASDIHMSDRQQAPPPGFPESSWALALRRHRSTTSEDFRESLVPGPTMGRRSLEISLIDTNYSHMKSSPFEADGAWRHLARRS